MGRTKDQILPVDDGVDAVHFGLQRKIGYVWRGSRISGRDKAASDIAGNHIADGLGMAGIAGNDGIKIQVFKKTVYHITDTGTLQLQDKRRRAEVLPELAAVQCPRCTGS